jgi:hypothetical protein
MVSSGFFDISRGEENAFCHYRIIPRKTLNVKGYYYQGSRGVKSFHSVDNELERYAEIKSVVEKYNLRAKIHSLPCLHQIICQHGKAPGKPGVLKDHPIRDADRCGGKIPDRLDS